MGNDFFNRFTRRVICGPTQRNCTSREKNPLSHLLIASGAIRAVKCVPQTSVGALDCLFEAEAVNINLRFQPVVHDFNGVAQLHRATRNNNAGLCQQA